MVAFSDLTDLTNSLDSDRQISCGQQIIRPYNQILAEYAGKQQIKSVNFLDE
jgi:hypothetical protein